MGIGVFYKAVIGSYGSLLQAPKQHAYPKIKLPGYSPESKIQPPWLPVHCNGMPGNLLVHSHRHCIPGRINNPYTNLFSGQLCF